MASVLPECWDFFFFFLILALAGVAQWIEGQPANGKVTSLISSQGTCLGCWARSWLGTYKKQPIDVSLAHRCFSPSFSFPSPLSKNK